jgi:hypothetical protein
VRFVSIHLKESEGGEGDSLAGLVRLLGLLLLSLLLVYWLSFAVWSAGKLILGGPKAVLAWYMHIDMEGSLSRHWSALRFLFEQGGVAVVTLGLWFAVRPRRMILR